MTKRKLKIPGGITCSVIVLLSTATALAQEENFKFELTPYGGYRVGGEFEETDGDLSIDSTTTAASVSFSTPGIQPLLNGKFFILGRKRARTPSARD
jgi:hypothetical protein